MSQDLQALKEEVCRVGRALYAREMVSGADGNISVRLDAARVLCTPTRISKGRMRPEDLAIVDLEGKTLAGARKASSEIAMHLLYYKLRPDANAVVHAHPITATGFGAAGRALNEALLSEAVLALGCVPLAPYGTPGTDELLNALKGLMPEHDAVLMANHGVVTCGKDLESALWVMETVEHVAKTALVTEILGHRNLLSDKDVAKLMEAKKAYYGLDSVPQAPADCPVTEEARAQGRDCAPAQESNAKLIADALKYL